MSWGSDEDRDSSVGKEQPAIVVLEPDWLLEIIQHDVATGNERAKPSSVSLALARITEANRLP